MDELLRLVSLKKYFYKKAGFLMLRGKRDDPIRAVDGVDVSISRGECFGLVGETGCGKTTLARVVAGLYEPTDGKVLYEGSDISQLTRKREKKYARKIQMVFQNPKSSLDPRRRVKDIIATPLHIHGLTEALDQRVDDLIYKVKLTDEHRNAYPHQLSGGQQQRVSIARALAVNPELLIGDELVSALDVSIQASILSLIKDLQNDLGLTVFFISHDLNVVHYMSDQIGVMYKGKIVELGNAEEISNRPLHPYTKLLQSSTPPLDPRKREEWSKTSRKMSIETKGIYACSFYNRCPIHSDVCVKKPPELIATDRFSKNRRFVRCHKV